MQLVFRFLNRKPCEHWGSKEQSALQSAFHQQAVDAVPAAECRHGKFQELPEDTSTAHHGTLLHRIWTCPVTERICRERAPAWLRARVKQAIRSDGTMAAADLAVVTRELVASPAASLDPPPKTETFEWVQLPSDSVVSGKIVR